MSYRTLKCIGRPPFDRLPTGGLLAAGLEALLCALAMDHDEKDHVKHGLNECKGAIVHKTSLD